MNVEGDSTSSREPEGRGAASQTHAPGIAVPLTPSQDEVYERLTTHGWEFNFFQAVWLLERFRGGSAIAGYPAHVKPAMVGERGPVRCEPLRFRPHISMGFPPTDVRRIEALPNPDNNGQYFRINITFLGLYGVATPLPPHFARTLLIAQERWSAQVKPEGAAAPWEERAPKSDSPPQRDFLDLLHHRLISLFYRAWSKYRYDRSFGMPGRDCVTDYLRLLIGVPRGSDDLLDVPALRLIRYAGILTQQPRSAATLEGMLSDFWEGLPVQIEQFVGRWVALAATDMNRIGMLNSTLGEDLTVGEQVYDLGGRINIQVGPVDWNTYLTFLPDGQRYAEAKTLVQLYNADPFSFTLEIKLMPDQIPQSRLGGAGGARLGYTTWIATKEMPETSAVFDATPAGPFDSGAARTTAAQTKAA